MPEQPNSRNPRRANKLLRMSAVVALSLLSAWPSIPATAQHDKPTEAAVRTLWATVDDSWNARDVDRFSGLFTDDASFALVDNGLTLDGREAIHRHFSRQFPNTAPALRHQTLVREVHSLTRNIVALDGTVEIIRVESQSDQTLLRTFAVFALMQPVDDHWKIRVFRGFQLRSDEAARDAEPAT